MELTIVVNLDNAAFHDEALEDALEYVLGLKPGAAQSLATLVEKAAFNGAASLKVRDSNGNTCGRIQAVRD